MESEINSKLEQLEAKIRKLLVENFDYRQKISNFEVLLKAQAEQVSKCEAENTKLKLDIEQFKLGQAFAGNKEDNEEAKAKIDSLIKEINLCIATLKD